MASQLGFKSRTFDCKSSSLNTTQQGNVRDTKAFIHSCMQNI